MGHLEPANYLFLEGYVLGHVPFRPHAGHWVRSSLVGSRQFAVAGNECPFMSRRAPSSVGSFQLAVADIWKCSRKVRKEFRQAAGRQARGAKLMSMKT